MVQSLNSTVDFVVDATFYATFPDYGKIMVGNNAFEFYSDSNPMKCLQLKWEMIDRLVATVKFKGKWIPRFAIVTTDDKVYYFASKNSLMVLKCIRKYIPSEKMTKSLTIIDIIKKKLKLK